MTVGDGIFYSTLLLMFGAAVHQITVRKLWTPVIQVVAAMAALAVALHVFGIWRDQQSKGPMPPTELMGIRVGMRPVDVSLKLGEPSLKRGSAPGPVRWLYGSTSDGLPHTLIVFGDGDEGATVRTICRANGYEELLGIASHDSERRVLEVLGTPSATSVAADGLRQAITYEQYDVTYELEKGNVTTICLNSGAPLRYRDEHAEHAVR
jgi:hypothetical protein